MDSKAYPVKPGLTHVSLQRLSVLLGRAIARYEILGKAAGWNVFKKRAGYGRVFVRKLHIRADKDAPWAFVQWTAMVAAERKITNLQLALEGKRTLDLPLPAYEGAWQELVMHLDGYPDTKPPPHVVVEVYRAKRTVYCVGDEETRSPEQLEAILRKRLAKKKPAPKVVVRAALNARFQGVVTAFDRIYAAGVKEMWWLGEHIPHPDFRKLDRLPPPPR
jgi:biopolymer transport protein ExbD